MDFQQRCCAPNRASQRAFRERKERYVRELESQLQVLQQRYKDLLKSYLEKTEKVAKLKQQIQELTAEIDKLPSPQTSIYDSPDVFDMIPYPDRS